MKRKDVKKSDPPQSFEQAAAALDCSFTEEAFNAALGKIARAKPVEPPVKKPAAKKLKP